MKLQVVTVILLKFFVSSSFATEPRFNLVYDLDYTLFHLVDKKVSERTIMASDKKLYEPIAWGVEGIENALARGIDISFFSGGEEKRNISLLKQVKLSDGRSLFDIAKGIYSKKDLEQISDIGSFSERYKKNLSRLGFNMKRTLLVDDLENFVPAKHKLNILWLGKTYHHFNTYKEAELAVKEAKLDLKYIPVTKDQWFISKNKMKYVVELILDAKENVKNVDNIINYIHRHKNRYIPYNEVISSRMSELVNETMTPSICFRNHRLFSKR